ncbi:MAG: SMP-30/gluconolactonase/LRE family protein [Planctomycetes bacterium]|nr:SMP-30/gluconolactonase/LRE family protein [Planctomycetota bacterium]
MTSTTSPVAVIHAEPLVRTRTVLGEGVLWDARTQVLYWLDIMAGEVFAVDPRTGVSRAYPIGQHVGTIVPRASGGLMLAVVDGFAAFDPASGAVRMVARVAHGRPNLRFNDGKCDPAGRFWAGTMAYDGAAGAGCLHRLDADRSVHAVLSGVTISNGLAWSADARTMYYIDTPTRVVSAFDADPVSGAIARRRTCIEIPHELGLPDGMAIDERGMLWIALHESGRVGCWDPHHGRLLAMIEVPGAKLVTNCAFGGADLDELYISTASIGLDDEALRFQPLAGSLFKARPGVRGVPAHAFAG